MWFSFYLSIEKVLVGKKNGNPVPDIILGSIGIKPNHAEFAYDGEGKIYLTAYDVKRKMIKLITLG